jgi:hypothetical protein
MYTAHFARLHRSDFRVRNLRWGGCNAVFADVYPSTGRANPEGTLTTRLRGSLM